MLCRPSSASRLPLKSNVASALRRVAAVPDRGRQGAQLLVPRAAAAFLGGAGGGGRTPAPRVGVARRPPEGCTRPLRGVRRASCPECPEFAVTAVVLVRTARPSAGRVPPPRRSAPGARGRGPPSAGLPAPTRSLAPCSGWLAAIGFFQTSVGAAVVMLLPAIMFTMSAAIMAIVIMKVSPLGPETSGFSPRLLSPDPPGPGDA